MREKEHIIEVLEGVKRAVEKDDVVKLKELSNQTIHSASIHQDIDSVTLAVIVYSLSKILERTHYQKFKGWSSFLKHFISHIDKAEKALKRDDEKEFRKELGDVNKDINKLSGDFKKNIQDVFRKARINKASRIYEHGISMETTAKLLGVSLWELAEYAGQTGISDVPLGITVSVKDRIKLAKEFFK